MLPSTYDALKDAFYANRVTDNNHRSSDDYGCYDDDDHDDDDADCFCG